MRGEQFETIRESCFDLGSPPLARGTVRKVEAILKGDGITPACAGNRNRATKNWEEARDHPRLRGEQPIVDVKNRKSPGSPPLARGTGVLYMMGKATNGITPACAGNSQLTKHRRNFSEDHPRLRGEQYTYRGHTQRIRGSPPLARGTARDGRG